MKYKFQVTPKETSYIILLHMHSPWINSKLLLTSLPVEMTRAFHIDNLKP